jgi:hypothetical protein
MAVWLERGQLPEAVNLSAAQADLAPAVLAVRVYGCAPRRKLDLLATKSSRPHR